jgi:DNA-directed RNA polymerase specialized sigma24 family protein
MTESLPSSHRPSGSPAGSDFEQVYLGEYERIARTVFLVVRDAGLAEELTQEAFVRLYLRWATVGRYERPGAWVRKVAIRLATR